MNFIQASELKKIFKLLNEAEVNYILMRNLGNEIPSNLIIGKDIDILINRSERNKIIKFLNSNEYKIINHPLKNATFLYGVDKFEFLFNKNNKILFDLNFQISVKSLDFGQIIPLDQSIQESAWKNKRLENLNDSLSYWTFGYEDEFVCLVARSIFDKNKFELNYIERINKILNLINKDDVIFKLNKVFFKFTPSLIKLIEDQKFNKIINNYLEFREY